MRLGGSAVIHECSFLSNLATSARGLAVAIVGWSTIMSGSLFDGNELLCPVGSYRNDTEEVTRSDCGVSRYAVRRCCFARVFVCYVLPLLGTCLSNFVLLNQPAASGDVCPE